VDTDHEEMVEAGGEYICENCAGELEAKADLANDALNGK